MSAIFDYDKSCLEQIWKENLLKISNKRNLKMYWFENLFGKDDARFDILTNIHKEQDMNASSQNPLQAIGRLLMKLSAVELKTVSEMASELKYKKELKVISDAKELLEKGMKNE